MTNNINSFNVFYDDRSDVLYARVRSDAVYRTVEDSDGIFWRYADNGELIGATVLDFNCSWRSTVDNLISILSETLEVPLSQVDVAIRALKEKSNEKV